MANTPTNLNDALEYARAGMRVFPLFYVLKDGGCSCRPRPGHPCKRIGKHPMTENGVLDAYKATEEDIRRWWTESPHANIGLATGLGGLVVMDIDDGPKRDKAGAVIGQKVGTESL
jgi:putative DNA primase/helicase